MDFSSSEPQYIADLGNIKKYYSEDDPGIDYVIQGPVIYNEYSSTHLAEKEQRRRLSWLRENQDSLIKAIVSPDIIEKRLRSRKDGHYSATLIVRLPSGDSYLVAAVSLSLELPDGYHQITTIHPAKWSDFHHKNGEMKKKYREVN